MVISSHGIKLHGLIEILRYLMMASGGPSQAAKYISQTLVVSSINRPVLQYLNYLGCINPNYITQNYSNRYQSPYQMLLRFWKSTYFRKSNCATTRWDYVYSREIGSTGQIRSGN